MNSWRLLTKYAITTLTVVVVSEVAKISDKIGGLLAALPLVTILTLIWLHVEGESTEKISLHAWYTFWYVVPTLPMFVAFPIFYDYLNFWWSLMLVCVLTILCFESERNHDFAMWAYVIFKYFATASMVVAVAEVAKRNDRLGGLLAALPLVTVMTLIWLEVENQSKELISNHAWYTLWYVIPTLPMFLGFPVLYEKLMFWRALGVSMLMTIAMAVVVALILLPFGIHIIF